MPTGFHYFLGPAKEMAGWSDQVVHCWYCGQEHAGFRLDDASCRDLTERERAGKFGCMDCLRQGRFEFWHDTDIGLLDEEGLTHVYKHNGPPPDGFPVESLVGLRRTPQIVTWQQELWLTHCRDFMAYLGTWEPKDFVAHARDGNGRGLFLLMTRSDEERFLWDSCCDAGADVPTGWRATYYVFQCRHCGALAGNWDCD